jgi:CysZ protein
MSCILFSLAIYGGWILLDPLSAFAASLLPQWLAWLHWLLYPLFIVIISIGLFFGFTWVANLLGIPFNGILSKRVEAHLLGKQISPLTWEEIPNTTQQLWWGEIQKILYSLRYFFPLCVISLIPIINLISPILWFLWGAWSLYLQYIAYPLENNEVPAKKQQVFLDTQRSMGLGFGCCLLLVSLIPVVNFLTMPAAVAGATILWVHEFRSKNFT